MLSMDPFGAGGWGEMTPIRLPVPPPYGASDKGPTPAMRDGGGFVASVLV